MAEANRSGLAADRKKLYVLAGLFVVLLGAVYYAFTSGPEVPPSSAAPPPPQTTAGPDRVRASDLAKTPDQKEDAERKRIEDDLGPVAQLELYLLDPRPVGSAVARNPFAYPPPPPPPVVKPPPPPPPPTIAIGDVMPGSVVAGVPRGVTVTVTGNQFPADARVLWNGRQLPTEVAGPTTLRVNLSPAEIASPGTVEVKVISESQPDRLWSAPRSFTVTPSPTPPFKYIGKIGDQAVLDFEGQRDGNRKLVRVGDTIGVGTQWKVLAINVDKIDVLDVRNEIRKSVALAKKS
jgi:hypothetical protein